MTKSMRIQTVTSLCLVVVCLILVDKVEGFSNLKLIYRALIDIVVVLSALRLADYIAKFIEKHRKENNNT